MVLPADRSAQVAEHVEPYGIHAGGDGGVKGKLFSMGEYVVQCLQLSGTKLYINYANRVKKFLPAVKVG